MICLIYVLYFVAKSLVLTNKRRHVTQGDYAWSLFLLIQPRINQLYAERKRD